MLCRRPVAILLLFIICEGVYAAESSDRFFGDWEGTGLAAQVIPRGNGRYRINLLPQFDTRVEPLAIVEGRMVDATLSFDQDGWKGVAKADRLTIAKPGTGQNESIVLKRVLRPSPRVGAKPPDGAIVLFDGTGFENWDVQAKRVPADRITWKLVDDFMRVTPIDPKTRAGHSLVTKRKFKDFRLHFEFRLPLMADKTGQARANGGLVFEDVNWYEVQVLDSYGLEGLDNECGGIYKVGAPAINMCRPPLIWQTYDIEYHAPRYDSAGNRTKPGRISVIHNGVTIHNDVELPDSEKAERRRKADPTGVNAGRIILHYHKDPVEYRNIWLEEL